MNIIQGSREYGLNPNSRLWKAVRLGQLELKHRVGMAPLTRYRAVNHIPNPLMANYYAQRSTQGGLLISEATFISKEAGYWDM